MNPEVQLIDLRTAGRTQAIFDGQAGLFGRTYADGQNQLRLRTPSMGLAITRLQEARLLLAEVRARQAAEAALADPLCDDPRYRRELANHFARAYLATGGTILTAIQRENSNLGLIDNVYRANMTFGGASLKALGGIGLISAAVYGLITGPNATIAAEAGIFISATGILDATRHLFLRLFLRNGRNTNVASTANLIRRQASISEGLVTGDETDDLQPINQELEQRLAREILIRLTQDGIQRPNLLNPADFSGVLRQRESLRSILPTYENLPELVRSRNIARFSRLTRTLLYSALAAGLVLFHFSRPQAPQDCGTSAFFSPDTHMQEITGANKVSSVRGMAEAMLFKRIFGRDFNLADPKDREDYDKAIELDRETNEQVIEEIYRLIRAANPDIVTGGLISHAEPVNNLCQGDISRAINP